MTTAPLICGVDEAGRGALAGSVFAAAVILNMQDPIAGIMDSKQLTATQRNRLAQQIKDRALAWHVASASHDEIDQINILQASLLAMSRAISGLTMVPHRVLVDGLHTPDVPYPIQAVVRGDAIIPAISAASILAKTARDAAMNQLDQLYPQYAFSSHKGYPTTQHRALLNIHGASPVHRKSYKPVQAVLQRHSER